MVGFGTHDVQPPVHGGCIFIQQAQEYFSSLVIPAGDSKFVFELPHLIGPEIFRAIATRQGAVEGRCE